MTKGVNKMTKQSKEQKDLNPLTYGYSSPVDIPGNEGCGKQVVNGVVVKVPYKVPYSSFKDSDGDVRYVPSEKKTAYALRNFDSELRRKERLEERCLIPVTLKVENGQFVYDPNSNHKTGFKRCTFEDCRFCPFKFDPKHPDRQVDYERTGKPISMNRTYEDKDGNESEMEVADTESLSPLDALIEKEKNEALWRYLSEFDTDVQQMIYMHVVEDKSYREIALIFNRSKTAVGDCINRYLNILREKLKDY